MDDLSDYLLATGWQDCKVNGDNAPVERKDNGQVSYSSLIGLACQFFKPFHILYLLCCCCQRHSCATDNRALSLRKQFLLQQLWRNRITHHVL